MELRPWRARLPAGPDEIYCQVCGEEIREARRKASLVLALVSIPNPESTVARLSAASIAEGARIVS
jgi:hypothetical protein